MSVQLKTHALLAGMATGGLIAAGVIGLGTPAASAVAGCSDVEVVFARGTAEPTGFGHEGQAFIDSLKGDLKGKTVSAYAVDYPASYDFMQATAGAKDAGAHVQATVASCPSTKIVLGGYSQGAAVIDGITGDPASLFGLGQPMPPEVANHVAAVAVFGNPLNRFGGSLNALSPLYGAKTIDLCNGADPVCSPGDDRAAHSQYVEAGLTAQAATFAADQVKANPASAV
ncbi:cutinase [Mycobacterium antarcticum]|uniref:cutinase family protein n=1 Tax=unclassified Mycolicibacterium TaxID=2636767 RepID=UPI002383334F|nr:MULTISPECIES: cutinase family protein [unclassified Mycolicibacterium]BDX33306.1 cutinase [Mycolicibacterium sp. TUM20985]GLP76524.1 cutinase [Mycolicibacterium sp. TUM20983]GLP83140.1 cutinase [Mycolicibacterium sp. TUM20984]